MLETSAIRELTAQGIHFKIFTHSGPVDSLEQAATERGQTPEQVVRSILFRLSAREYLLVLMPGPRQISWKSLRALLQQNRLTLASDDEVFAVTGYRPGAVSPFGLPQPLRILADPAILAQPEISFGSGVRGTAILLSPAELRRAIPHLEVVELGA